MQIAPLFYPLSLVEINLKKRLRNRTKPLNVTLANFNFTGKNDNPKYFTEKQ